MAARKKDRKLGRSYAFLKHRLLELPQSSLTMEVDFCPLPDIPGVECGFWLGLVVDHHDGSILISSIIEQPPTLDDVADLVAAAISTKVRCRPKVVLLRDNPEWEGLFPYLHQLKIDALVAEDLLYWDAKAEELMGWIKDRWPHWPKVTAEREKELAVSKTLYELREMAHWYLPMRQPKSK